ncbi:RICIN domain-containing protein [Thiocapsa bogorovii]|uniref:RICIN domain-containing protein n=1 Tax=Thiocapsa bogorovii TaxID=521689 RepID=UPI0038CD2EA5
MLEEGAMGRSFGALFLSGVGAFFITCVDVVGAAEIVGQLSKCLDVNEASTRNGTPVILWPCHGGENQQWHFRQDLSLVGPGGKCLSVIRGREIDGAPVVIDSCDGTERQRWVPERSGELVGLAGRCLDVEGGLGEDGARLIVWPCGGTANQQWGALNAWREKEGGGRSGVGLSPPVWSIETCSEIGNMEGEKPYTCKGPGGGRAGFWGRKPEILVRFRGLLAGEHKIEVRFADVSSEVERDLSALNRSWAFENSRLAWAIPFTSPAAVGEVCQECRVTILLDGLECGHVNYSGSMD